MAENARAMLKFNGGSAQKVLKLNYKVARSADASGRVSSDPSNAIIKVTVEATDKSDIMESLLNGKFKPTKGEIIFNKSHEEGTLITLKWENGYVIDHEVDFMSLGSDNNMYIHFEVSAEKITYGGGAYDGQWPKTA
ncbi:MAG: hypothetical protein E6Q66_10010 [Pedobacter sp.]|nr:MAG: hypothetical protein E6Q66_10010 [Pedobacter sp.]